MSGECSNGHPKLPINELYICKGQISSISSVKIVGKQHQVPPLPKYAGVARQSEKFGPYSLAFIESMHRLDDASK